MERQSTSYFGRLAGTLIASLVRRLTTPSEARPTEPGSELDPSVSPDPQRIATGALLRQLDRTILAWEVEFRAFLHGDRQRVPHQLAATIESTFGEIVGLGALDPEHRFLLETLEWRYASAKKRFRRLVAVRERPALHAEPALRLGSPLPN